MGSFWTNLHLRTSSPPSLARTLSALALTPSYVAAPRPGWLSVYPEATETQDEALLTRALAGLSRALAAPGFATLMHDGDVLLVLLADARGAVIDRYDSAPGYFSGEGGAPTGGDAARFVATLGLDLAASDLAAIFRPTGAGPGTPAGAFDELERQLAAQRAELRAKLEGRGLPPARVEAHLAQWEAAMAKVQAQLAGLAGQPVGSAPASLDAESIAAALESALGFAPGALSTGFHYAAEGEGPEGLELVDRT